METQKRPGRKRECSVTLKYPRLLLSSEAGEGLLGRINAYERGGVLALVAEEDGDLNPICNSRRSTRKDICCHSLCAYLMDKFSLPQGGKLTAWKDESGKLLFGRPENQAEAQVGFDASFHRLSIPIEQFETCSLFFNHGVVLVSRAGAKRLGARVTLYEHGGVLCLADDPAGTLEVQARSHSEKGIPSPQLVEYLRGKFPNAYGRLPARVYQGRVYFSETPPPITPDFSRFTPLPLTMERPEDCVYLMKSGELQVASGLIGLFPSGRLALYERGDVLALAPAPPGQGFHIARRQGVRLGKITSRPLGRYLASRFCCGNPCRFVTCRTEEAVFFSNRALESEDLVFGQFHLSIVNAQAPKPRPVRQVQERGLREAVN